MKLNCNAALNPRLAPQQVMICRQRTESATSWIAMSNREAAIHPGSRRCKRSASVSRLTQRSEKYSKATDIAAFASSKNVRRMRVVVFLGIPRAERRLRMVDLSRQAESMRAPISSGRRARIEPAVVCGGNLIPKCLGIGGLTGLRWRHGYCSEVC